ncbi:MAG: triose-phosphate isomerase, partial [Christensenella sp.]
MLNNFALKPPFFEIGPKSYLFGDDVLRLALYADAAAKRYDVDIIFTTPLVELRRVAEATERIFVFAPHMDPIMPGRGLA